MVEQEIDKLRAMKLSYGLAGVEESEIGKIDNMISKLEDDLEYTNPELVDAGAQFVLEKSVKMLNEVMQFFGGGGQ